MKSQKDNTKSFANKFFFAWIYDWILQSNASVLSINRISETPDDLKPQLIYQGYKHQWSIEQTKSNPSYLKLILKVHQKDIILIMLLQFLWQLEHIFISVIAGIIIDLLIIDDENKNIMLLTPILILLILLYPFLLTNSLLMSDNLGNKIRGGTFQLLSQIIFKQQNQSSKIINYFDSLRLIKFAPQALLIWIYLILLMIVQYYILGWVCAIFLSILICFCIANYLIQVFIRGYKIKLAQIQQRKNNLVAEHSILQIQINGWQDEMLQLIMDLKSEESKLIKQSQLLKVVSKTLQITGGTFILLIIYWIISVQEQELSVGQVATILINSFLAIAQINLLANKGFLALNKLQQFCKEIQVFLTFKGIQQSYSECIDPQNAIEVQNLEVIQKGQVMIKDATFNIQKGQLVIIAGESSKKSFLQEVLNSHNLDKIKVSGIYSYAQCNPFILHGTIRDNIILQQPLNQEQYSQILKATQLKKALKCFSEGDYTIIGNPQVSISSKLKIQIGLARALYINSDIYVMDNLFTVKGIGKKIFQNCIKDRLKEKTVILSTNKYLQDADQVIFIQNQEVHQVTNVQNNQLLNKLPKKIIENQKDLLKIQTEIEEYQSSYFFWYLLLYFKSYFFLICWIVLSILIQFLLIFTIYMSIELTQSDNEITSRQIYTIISLQVILTAIIYVNIKWIKFALITSSNKLYESVVRSIFDSNIQMLDNRIIQKIKDSMTNDFSIIENKLTNKFSNILVFGILFLSIIIFLCVIEPFNLINIIPILILIIYIRSVFSKVQRHFKCKDELAKKQVNQSICSQIGNISTIKAFHAQKLIKDCIDNQIAQAINDNYYWIQIQSGYTCLQSTLINVSAIIAITLTIALHNQHDNTFLAMSIILPIFAMTFGCMLMAAQGNADALMQTFSQIKSLIQTTKSEQISNFEIKRGCIKFQDVTVQHEPNCQIKDFSFKFSSEEKYGIIGGNKLVFLLLLKIIQTEKGIVKIDGQDIQDISTKVLRQSISYLPKVPFTYQGTIRQNLDPLNSYSDDEIQIALIKSNLLNIVQNQPLQLDSKINDCKFSYSQSLLINLARIFLKRPKILLIDDFAQYADNFTKNTIKDAIKKNFSDTTLIAISKEAEHLNDYDRIIELDKGRLKGQK